MIRLLDLTKLVIINDRIKLMMCTILKHTEYLQLRIINKQLGTPYYTK